jgi:FkbM family methyltransferase
VIRTSIESQPVLRRLARAVLAVPFAKTAARYIARFAIQKTPISKKSKQRTYNLLAADAVPARPVACRIAMPNGGEFSVELDLTDDLSRRWYYWGYTDYERSTVLLWTRLLENVTTVFDVGANIGLYTLLAAAHLRGRGTVHAFEPNPDVFRALARSIDRNFFTHAHTAQLALSDSDGETNFFLPKDRAWTNGSLIEGFTDQDASLVIETMRFDTYCAKFQINKVDLIKVDVEGAELRVLRGMGELLQRWKPHIICEVLEGYSAPLNEFFAAMPYRKFLITPHGLQEMDELRPSPKHRDYYQSCAPIILKVAHVPFTFALDPVGGTQIYVEALAYRLVADVANEMAPAIYQVICMSTAQN